MALALVLRRLHLELLPISEYEAEVKMTTSDPSEFLLLERVRVTNHRRTDSWEGLICRYVIQHHRDLVQRMLREE